MTYLFIYLFIYYKWVSTRWQWSVKLYTYTKETAIYKRRNNTQNNTKTQKQNRKQNVQNKKTNKENNLKDTKQLIRTQQRAKDKSKSNETMRIQPHMLYSNPHTH